MHATNSRSASRSREHEFEYINACAHTPGFHLLVARNRPVPLADARQWPPCIWFWHLRHFRFEFCQSASGARAAFAGARPSDRQRSRRCC